MVNQMDAQVINYQLNTGRTAKILTAGFTEPSQASI